MGQPSVRRSAAKSCARLENEALQHAVRKGTVTAKSLA